MGRENLADELLLLALCQLWNVLWSHSADFLLGFHNRSEFGCEISSRVEIWAHQLISEG